MHLLDDPVFSASVEGARKALSLPELLEVLSSDRPVELLEVPAHQRHFVHVFLVQLAASAIDRAGLEEVPASANEWRAALEHLTEGSPSFWKLIEPNPSLPAFLQTPMSDEEDDYGGIEETPDVFDVLVASKSHELKIARTANAREEHWAYTLIASQTGSAYVKGYFHIARINGGLGTRVVAGLYSDCDIGTQFREDLERLLGARAALGEEEPFNRGGIILTSLAPWDGKSQISLSALHPWFIDCARRVRLVERNQGRIGVRRASSTCARIAADETHGALDDPWTPIDLRDEKVGPKSLSLSDQGFKADLLVSLLTQQGIRAPLAMQALTWSAPTVFLRMTGIARDQGATKGFHDLCLELPRPAMLSLFGPSATEGLRERIARLSQAALDLTAEARKTGLIGIDRTVRPDEDRPDPKKEPLASHRERFRKAVNAFERAELIPYLFSALDATDEAVLKGWAMKLKALITEYLRANVNTLCTSSARRLKASVLGEDAFRAMFKTRVLSAFEEAL